MSEEGSHEKPEGTVVRGAGGRDADSGGRGAGCVGKVECAGQVVGSAAPGIVAGLRGELAAAAGRLGRGHEQGLSDWLRASHDTESLVCQPAVRPREARPDQWLRARLRSRRERRHGRHRGVDERRQVQVERRREEGPRLLATVGNESVPRLALPGCVLGHCQEAEGRCPWKQPVRCARRLQRCEHRTAVRFGRAVHRGPLRGRRHGLGRQRDRSQEPRAEAGEEARERGSSLRSRDGCTRSRSSYRRRRRRGRPPAARISRHSLSTQPM